MKALRGRLVGDSYDVIEMTTLKIPARGKSGDGRISMECVPYREFCQDVKAGDRIIKEYVDDPTNLKVESGQREKTSWNTKDGDSIEKPLEGHMETIGEEIKRERKSGEYFRPLFGFPTAVPTTADCGAGRRFALDYAFAANGIVSFLVDVSWLGSGATRIGVPTFVR
ncbi:hypothetical protein L1987_20077 [Smallanthus sonchifolius]|uniref:Uncharacterized protein n=1 Tax=Smallanthus sonchifolius TaxID=185202 RepID=A0ACB9IR18_9ASTR|nr:hypothetical protein L1987_20077 [Smallanthus sonchifolius]